MKTIQCMHEIKICEHMVWGKNCLGETWFGEINMLIKRSKLVKNGSVYAAANSRHLWRTRPGGSVWGGRPMNREWRGGILGTFPGSQQVGFGCQWRIWGNLGQISYYTSWVLVANRETKPPNQLQWVQSDITRGHLRHCRVSVGG